MRRPFTKLGAILAATAMLGSMSPAIAGANHDMNTNKVGRIGTRKTNKRTPLGTPAPRYGRLRPAIPKNQRQLRKRGRQNPCTAKYQSKRAA